MTTPVAFRIQRADEQWFFDRGVDGAVTWVADSQRAHLFGEYREALDVLEWLRRQGYQVRLYGTA